MDKYPVFREEQTVGELTVTPEALYTAFSVSCRGRAGQKYRNGIFYDFYYTAFRYLVL